MRRGLALAVTASIALAACTQTPGTTGSPSPGASASASAGTFTRGQGGELKILYWQAPTILNTHQATGTKDYDAARLIQEPLASWGVDGKPVANGLAKTIPTVDWARNGALPTDRSVNFSGTTKPDSTPRVSWKTIPNGNRRRRFTRS